MTRFCSLGLICLLSLASAGAAEQPNFLIIVADDLGYADVGFNGGETIRTPNLDRLASSGVILEDFRACPMCSPTRAGLLTGRWPLRFGMMRSVVPPWSTYGLPAAENTLPELLAPLGYKHRGIIGKWHLGQARREHLPLAHGFTRFYGHYSGAIDYFTKHREGERDWHDDDRTSHDEGYATDLLGAEAVRFLRQVPAGEPWFLYVPFNAPHSPYQAKRTDLQKYAELKRPNRRAYAAMVDSMDQAIGRILETLESRPDAANTLVLFFSDNGGIPEVGSNGPYRAGKLTVYEGGTRVCAAIRWPAAGLEGGRRYPGRIGYIDVLPTLLAAAGGEAPAHVDGWNVLPALRGEAELLERPWFSYLHQQKGGAHVSVHLGQWKLVVHGDYLGEAASPKSGRSENNLQIELYDLERDPAEAQNVARRHPDTLKKLHALLQEFGTWQQPGIGAYGDGRAGFVAPKDWVITN